MVTKKTTNNRDRLQAPKRKAPKRKAPVTKSKSGLHKLGDRAMKHYTPASQAVRDVNPTEIAKMLAREYGGWRPIASMARSRAGRPKAGSGGQLTKPISKAASKAKSIFLSGKKKIGKK